MSYQTDIGSLRFLAAHTMYQLTVKLLQGDDAEDRGALHDATQLMDVITSYYTENDETFLKEIALIQYDRKKAKAALKPGMELHESMDEAFRLRELKAMFRSLCRQGIFVRQSATEAEWTPTVKP